MTQRTPALGPDADAGSREPPRRPDEPRRQEDRSRSTRLRLIEATIGCLVDHGWSGTTTTAVAERAGVSRGAQLHHYPTRSELVIAAVQHLAEIRINEIRRRAAELPDTGPRAAAVLDMLAELCTGPLFTAALELWVAARTDDELRPEVAQLEAVFGRETHRLTVELLGANENKPGVRETVQATLDMMRGLGLANLLSDDSPRRTALLAAWATTLEERLGAHE